MTTPDTIARLTAEPAGEDVERVGFAIERTWNADTGDTFDLPPIELTDRERDCLARAAIAALHPTDDLRRTREAVEKIIALCETYAAAAGTSDEHTERPFEDGMTLAGYTLAGMIRDRFLSTVSKESEHG